MSLLCSESEDRIWSRYKAYMAVHPLGQGYAVGELAIARIPESERRTRPCGPMEEGLDIHEGVGTKSSGTWQFSTFETGRFLFSISEKGAKFYLPRTVLRIAGDIAADAM